MKSKKIGELLVESKIIDEKMLSAALEYQKTNSKRIGEIFVDLGYSLEEQIINALGKQLGYEIIDLSDVRIEENIAFKIPLNLLKQYKIFPVKIEGNTIYLAMLDPLNVIALDEVKLITGYRVCPMLTTEYSIRYALDHYFGAQYSVSQAIKTYKELKDESIGFVKETDLSLLINEIDSAPIVHLVESVINDAIRRGASDIHWEPKKNSFILRYRVDGVLHKEMSLSRSVFLPVVSRIKILSGLDIAERRKPQDGRFEWKDKEKPYDLRISIIPTIFGEKVVLRILYKEEDILNLKDLGFESDDLEQYITFLARSNGIILITGPTGCGKTTTLYASLQRLAKENVNITTIEDPVEYQIDNINQVQVNKKIDLTFSSGLRSLLRQDPDILMVGEIRDKETAEVAIQASLTGHLVLSSLHTNDAPSAVVRLINMGIEPYLISATLVGVISQRLVRKLCSCKLQYTPSQEELKKLKLEAIHSPKFHKSSGCKICSNYGYKGRIGIFEVMKITDNIRDAITKSTAIEEIRKKAMDEGMKTLIQNGTKKVISGITSTEEILRVVSI